MTTNSSGASFGEVANLPLEVSFGGRMYKVRRLPLDVMFGKAESAVVSRAMDRICKMAERLSGEERAEFLSGAVNKLPAGAKLTRLTDEYLRSVDGVVMCLREALRADQPTEADKLDIVSWVVSDPDKVTTIVQFLTGTSNKESAGAAGEGRDGPPA